MTPSPSRPSAEATVRTPKPPFDEDTLRALRHARLRRRRRRAQRVITRTI